MTIPTGPEAPVKKSKLKPLLIAAAVVAAIGVGYAAGSDSGSKTATVATPATLGDLALHTSVATVTATAAPTTVRTTETATTTIESTKVPAECLAALRDTDQLIDVTVDVLGITADMFGAVSEFDTVTLDRLTTKLDAKKIPMTSAVSSFKDHRDACLAAG